MRNETRPVKFSRHATQRMAQRGISQADAEQIVRHGATRPDADSDFIAFGSINGRHIEVACLDKGDHIFVKTVY